METRPNSVRLLVVDDDRSLADSMSLVFEVMGYTAVIEMDSRAALARLADETFDGLITDITMPGMSGIELARKARQIRPEMFVVFMTGNAKTVSEDAKAEAAAVLTKPFEIDDLRAAIDTSISRQREDG